jgi:hypothetical protein
MVLFSSSLSLSLSLSLSPLKRCLCAGCPVLHSIYHGLRQESADVGERKRKREREPVRAKAVVAGEDVCVAYPWCVLGEDEPCRC